MRVARGCARYRMAKQSGDRQLGKPHLGRRSCEAVPQYMDRHARQACAPACARQHARQAREMTVAAVGREDEPHSFSARQRSEECSRGGADWAELGAALGIGKSDAARLRVNSLQGSARASMCRAT